ncbi:TraB/GumN family protein [Brockia lithotrophica]|uniref:Uncharacterized protein YbaP (TraB family) n=1 Tax=Brockia lithotrophica TaxID=933949 RepID=A0A660LAC1_9BACL|nr:TraB/GumN family protein [Brockia lithotrophica]RKQ88913.1 uncharacterized protein YbaP (TraB family) [Brockia lithotrophica]
MVFGGRGARRLFAAGLALLVLLAALGCANPFAPSQDGKATSQALLDELRSQEQDAASSAGAKPRPDTGSGKKETRSSAPQDSAQEFPDLLKELVGGGESDTDVFSQLLGGLLGGGTKQEAVRPFAEGSAQGNRGLLFEAKKDGRTVYLMGTIHVAKREMYPFSPEVKKAFQEAGALAVEADVTSLGEQLATVKYTLDGMYSDGRTYRDALPKDVVQKIDEFKSRNRGSAMLIQDSFKPWYLYMMITQVRLSSSLLKDFSPAYGVDMVLIQEAKKLGKPVRSLEGASMQMELLSTLPDDVYAELLRKELSQDDAAYRQEMESLHEFLRTGDTAALERAAVADYRGKSQALETYYQKVIVERNQNMAQRIEEELQRDGRPLFVAVGAAHVVGPDGLAEIFRKKGYTVRQL